MTVNYNKMKKEEFIAELKKVRSRLTKLQKVQAKQKRAEEALRESERYVDSIIHSMADSLIVVSLDGIIRMVNQATCTLLG